MLARLDNLPQRHRSVKLHAAAPDVDFPTSMRGERIPGRHDPCSSNFPSHACHAKPPAIGISLAEIAGIAGILAAAVPRWAARLAYRLRKLRELQDPGGGRPALGREVGISPAEIAGTTRSWRRSSRAGPRGWHIACGNCGNYKIPAAAVPRWARDWQNASGNCGNPRHGPAAREDRASSEGSGVGGAEPGSPMTRDRPRH
jgi:hypothetical protein